MLRNAEDLEAQLERLQRRYERLEDGTYLVRLSPGQPPVGLRLVPPVLVLQVEVGPSPEDDSKATALFRKLLELNAGSLLHSAYGLEGSTIVLSSALELDNLDLNELEAVLADMDVALGEHVPMLRDLVQAASQA
jgi:Zn-dependent protease with chaperone function